MSRMMREAIDLYLIHNKLLEPEPIHIHKVLDDLEASVGALKALHSVKNLAG